MSGLLEVLFLLLAVHALADYPLQGDFLAKAKNRHAPIPGVPWWQALTAHALIHAGGVFVVTGSLAFAAIELSAHWLIDNAKCSGRLTFNADQMLHVICKIAYVAVLATGAAP